MEQEQGVRERKGGRDITHKWKVSAGGYKNLTLEVSANMFYSGMFWNLWKES